MQVTNLKFIATQSSGEVSAILQRPENANWLLVLGHGAGAGMRHAFMQQLSDELSKVRIATFRYQFPYMEQGRKSPNPQPISLKTVRSAVASALAVADDLPLLAGGKSYGGRMTSTAASTEALVKVHGLVFFGFPLHAPGRPSNDRAEHLYAVNVPMLFLQGTRDKLADLSLLTPVCDKLADLSTLHIVDGADHSFHVPKNTGRSQEQVIAELATTVANWAKELAI